MGGEDGIDPNVPENLILGTAGANGFHLRAEETIKKLVREHGEIYVRYEMDTNPAKFDARWHVCGKFAYEFGLVNYDLVDAYHAGKVEEDQVKGKKIDSVTIDTFDTRFPASTDFNALSTAAEVRYGRLIESVNKGQDVARKLNFDNIQHI
jgi:hypothetical protein